MITARTKTSILVGALAGSLRLEPYPHVVMDTAMPWDQYHALKNHRPTMEQILLENAPGVRPVGSNLRYDMNAREALALAGNGWDAGPWVEFIEYHTSWRFWNDIVDVFGRSIGREHGDVLTEMFPGDTLRELRVGIRPDPKADIQLDVGIGINTPNTGTTAERVRGPHIDNPVEVFAAMLYMRDPFDNSAGGDFIIDQTVGVASDLKFHGKAEITDDQVRPFAQIDYSRNRACAFINSLYSVHEVSPRSPSPHPRLLVNIIAEFNKPLFSYKHLRG